MTRSRSRRELDNFKLKTLLEVTEAINENLSTEQLLGKYIGILQNELSIGKCLLYHHEAAWIQIASYGYSDEVNRNLNIEESLIQFKDIATVPSLEQEDGSETDIVVPVFHKDKAFAYVIIGDIDENVQGLSPAIKHLRFIQTLTNIILVAIENQRLYEENIRQEAFRKELELASKMQGMLIPDKDDFPKLQGLKLSAFYHPHLEVGGDYYDFIPLSDDTLGFCIADVSGKGMAAAILMSNFQASLRALFTKDIPLKDLALRLNEIVNTNAKGEKYLTLFMGRYNTGTRKLEYINAAHLPPILFNPLSNTDKKLEKGCIGMGMLDEIYSIDEGLETIDPGAKLLCFTDGITELKFGTEVRDDLFNVEDFIRNNESIDVNVSDIIAELDKIKDQNLIFDDITLIGLQFD